jgi:hypothetical protein
MAFTPAHVGPWSVGEKLTSAQISQLDADHVNSVDKTGDSIVGGAVIEITDGNVSVACEGGVTADIASAIKSDAVDGIWINVANGLTLSGSTNYPKFAIARDVPRVAPFIPVFGTTGWSFAASGGVAGIYYVGPATVSAAYVDLTPFLINGATLTEVALDFAVTLAHPSIASMVLPKINVARTLLTVGQTASNGVSLNSGGQQTLPAPGSAAAYVNSNLTQSLIFPCNQNNIIDKTQYKYTAIITDENGSNSVASSTAALGFRLTQLATNLTFT